MVRGGWGLGTGGTVAAAALDAPSPRLMQPLALAPADRRFLRALTIDLAGRTPLPKEWQEAQGKPRGVAIRELAASRVGWEGFYEEELFYFLLVDNFRPSTDAFLAMPQLLEEGKLSVREALLQIVSSQFFNARNPGNDTFVTVVLEQLLGATVQKEPATLEAGKKMYDGYAATFLGKRGSSQADLVRIAVENEGFEPFLLERRFGAIFGDAPPKKRIAADAARLRADPLAWQGIVSEWLSSQAYEELLARPRPKSDRVFVRTLFSDLLGRAPEYQEFRRCRNALLALSDSRPLRSVLIKLMLDAGMGSGKDAESAAAADPAAFVADRFLHFLARAPTQEEETAFVNELRGGANPKLVLRALLTHAEYQSY
jgi:hypothetical protein